MQIIKIPLVFVLLIFVFGLQNTHSDENSFSVKHWQNSETIACYDVFEITFQHDQKYDNPFFDVSIEVTFTSPSGNRKPQVKVGGFHYGSLEKPTINRTKDDKGRINAQYMEGTFCPIRSRQVGLHLCFFKC